MTARKRKKPKRLCLHQGYRGKAMASSGKSLIGNTSFDYSNTELSLKLTVISIVASVMARERLSGNLVKSLSAQGLID